MDLNRLKCIKCNSDLLKFQINFEECVELCSNINCNVPVEDDLYFIKRYSHQAQPKECKINKTADEIYKNFDAIDVKDELNHLLFIFKHIFPSEITFKQQHCLSQSHEKQVDVNPFQDDDLLLHDDFLNSLDYDLLDASHQTKIVSCTSNQSNDLTFIDYTHDDLSQSSLSSFASSSTNPYNTSIQLLTPQSDDPFDGLNAISSSFTSSTPLVSNSSIEIIKKADLEAEAVKYKCRTMTQSKSNQNKVKLREERKRRISQVETHEDDNASDNDETLWWEKSAKKSKIKKSASQIEQHTKQDNFLKNRALLKERGSLLKDALIKETTKTLQKKVTLLNPTTTTPGKLSSAIPSGYKNLVLNVLKKKQIN